MKLQIRRNDDQIIGRKNALSVIQSVVEQNNHDGSPILIRYSESEDELDVIRTILVIVAPDGNYSIYEDMDVINNILQKKQNKLIEGNGISISGDTISIKEVPTSEHIYEGGTNSRVWREILRVKTKNSDNLINGQFTFLVSHNVFGGSGYGNALHNSIVNINLYKAQELSGEYYTDYNGQILGQQTLFKCKLINDAENGDYISVIAMSTFDLGVTLLNVNKTNSSEYNVDDVLSYTNYIVSLDSANDYKDMIPYVAPYTAGENITIEDNVISSNVSAPIQTISVNDVNQSIVNSNVNINTITGVKVNNETVEPNSGVVNITIPNVPIQQIQVDGKIQNISGGVVNLNDINYDFIWESPFDKPTDTLKYYKIFEINNYDNLEIEVTHKIVADSSCISITSNLFISKGSDSYVNVYSTNVTRLSYTIENNKFVLCKEIETQSNVIPEMYFFKIISYTNTDNIDTRKNWENAVTLTPNKKCKNANNIPVLINSAIASDNSIDIAKSNGILDLNAKITEKICDISDDAARTQLGGTWRMPTIDEFHELYNPDNTDWTEYGDCLCIKSKKNSNEIILKPINKEEVYATIDIWTSELLIETNQNNQGRCYHVGLQKINDTYNNSRGYGVYSDFRYKGKYIRPVCTSNEEGSVDLGLSVRWSTKYLGAEDETSLGTQYAWGETEPKTSFTQENYKFYTVDGFSKYNKEDGLTKLEIKDGTVKGKIILNEDGTLKKFIDVDGNESTIGYFPGSFMQLENGYFNCNIKEGNNISFSRNIYNSGANISFSPKSISEYVGPYNTILRSTNMSIDTTTTTGKDCGIRFLVNDTNRAIKLESTENEFIEMLGGQIMIQYLSLHSPVWQQVDIILPTDTKVGYIRDSYRGNDLTGWSGGVWNEFSLHTHILKKHTIDSSSENPYVINEDGNYFVVSNSSTIKLIQGESSISEFTVFNNTNDVINVYLYDKSNNEIGYWSIKQRMQSKFNRDNSYWCSSCGEWHNA